KILAHLLVCDEAQQSQQDLADGLGASISSVSTMTRLVEQLGLVERVAQPNERRVFYRVRPDAWTHGVEEQLSRSTALRQIAEEGLKILRDEPPPRRRRLTEVARCAALYEHE